MRRIRLVGPALAIAFAMVAGDAPATTYLDLGFGTPSGGATPRSLAMGSTGVAFVQGSDGVFLNPAALVLVGKRVSIDAALTLTQANEDRLVPIFDSFNSFTDETIIAINRNTYATGQGGVVWQLPIAMPIALAASTAERWDFDFDYFEEFRNPDGQTSDIPVDRLVQNREFTVEGRLRSASGGMGAEILPNARLGFAVHRYFGDVSGTRRVEVFEPQPPAPDTLRTLDQELSGWAWSVGTQVRVNERVDVGVSYEGAFKVDGTRTVESSVTSSTGTAVLGRESAVQTFEYPGTLRFGAAFRPRNRLRTVLAVDAARRFWDNTTNTLTVVGSNPSLRDTWDLGIGVEHVFYNGMPLRFGFRFLENYADAASERSIFSLGTGYHAAGTTFSVTGSFHRQTSRQRFLFDPSFTTQNGEFPAPESDPKVEDSILQLVVGASRTF